MILVKLLSARSRSAINQSGQASLIYAPPLLSGQRLQEERLDAHRAPTKGNNFLSQLIIMGISACVCVCVSGEAR